MGYPHVSAEVKSEIRNLLKTGMTGAEISEKTGVSTSTISKERAKLQRQGFDIWHRGSKIAMSIPCANEKPVEKEVAAEKRQTLRVERRIVRISGETTGYNYTIGQKDFSVIVQDNDGNTFSFETDDAFSAFVCELIDLIGVIEKERA